MDGIEVRIGYKEDLTENGLYWCFSRETTLKEVNQEVQKSLKGTEREHFLKSLKIVLWKEHGKRERKEDQPGRHSRTVRSSFPSPFFLTPFKALYSWTIVYKPELSSFLQYVHPSTVSSHRGRGEEGQLVERKLKRTGTTKKLESWVDWMTDKKIITRLEKLEQALFGGKLEDQFFEERNTSKTLFDDTLERTIFMMLLELALEGKIGATSALLAEQTKKTKNTVNVRLERLYYKRLIQKQEIGNAMLYYVPLQELLLGAITKELVALRLAQGDLPAEASAEELEKTILAKYLTDVQVVLGRSQEYFASLTKKTDYTQLNLKDELLQ
ncbi:MAG: hypothetical protein ACFFC7_08020 [Candidatus Hermodarchaeota archaeon]